MEFKFTINGRVCSVGYDKNTAKVHKRETNQMFLRTTVNGAFKLLGADYAWYVSQPFETKFNVLIERRLTPASAYVNYFEGFFYKIDTIEDIDLRYVEFKLTPRDAYTDILENWEKEFNLIALQPPKVSVHGSKRPIIQTYLKGTNFVTNYIGGVQTTTDVTPEFDETVLTNTHKFHIANRYDLATVRLRTGSSVPSALEKIVGDYVRDKTIPASVWYGRDFFYYIVTNHIVPAPSLGDPYREWQILDSFSNVVLFEGISIGSASETLYFPASLNPTAAAGTSITLTILPSEIVAFSRILVDKSDPTWNINPVFFNEDFLPVTDNYRKRSLFTFPVLTISNLTSATDLGYGKTEIGTFFQPPPVLPSKRYYPLNRNTWRTASLWFTVEVPLFDDFDDVLATNFEMRDGYEISQVLKTLLAQIAPTVVHNKTSAFSAFLYSDTTPVKALNLDFIITQKSNVLKNLYDFAATKAPTTLKKILDMLRDTMQVFWYVENGNFKLEHVSFFKKGGSYTTPNIQLDFTSILNKRANLPWAYKTNKFEYNVQDMPESFAFSWGDEVSEVFEGQDIAINSGLVNRGQTQEVQIPYYTTDIDALLAAPQNANKEGFALFATQLVSNKNTLPKPSIVYKSVTYKPQNGYMSFVYLHANFWPFNLPSTNLNINGVAVTATTAQNIRLQSFIAATELNNFSLGLIKTYLGNGEISEISVNFDSAKAEIKLSHGAY